MCRKGKTAILQYVTSPWGHLLSTHTLSLWCFQWVSITLMVRSHCIQFKIGLGTACSDTSKHMLSMVIYLNVSSMYSIFNRYLFPQLLFNFYIILQSGHEDLKRKSDLSLLRNVLEGPKKAENWRSCYQSFEIDEFWKDFTNS